MRGREGFCKYNYTVTSLVSLWLTVSLLGPSCVTPEARRSALEIPSRSPFACIQVSQYPRD